MNNTFICDTFHYNRYMNKLISFITNKHVRNSLRLSVLAILGFSLIQFAFANHNEEYDEIVSYGVDQFQEDRLYVNVDGDIYVNGGSIDKDFNSFVLIDYIITEYSKTGVSNLFGIKSETSFIVEPSYNNEFLDILFLYQFNDKTDMFELTKVYEDVSGLDQLVTTLHNDNTQMSVSVESLLNGKYEFNSELQQYDYITLDKNDKKDYIEGLNLQ